MNKFDERIISYIEKVISDAFVSENRENDSEYVLYSLNSKHYILWIKSGWQRVLNRIDYRLAQNFRKNFKVGISIMLGRAARVGFCDHEYVAAFAAHDDNIDVNHVIFHDDQTPFGGVTINIVPKDHGPFVDVLYPGYWDQRVLYRDLVAYRGDDLLTYRGKEGWEEFCSDYAAVCDGLKPDHSIKVEQIAAKYIPGIQKMRKECAEYAAVCDTTNT